jgi:hypothetical protein
MEVFPFVFCHPLEPVDPCLEGNCEGLLSTSVESVDDRAFWALPARDVIFGEFSFDITK